MRALMLLSALLLLEGAALAKPVPVGTPEGPMYAPLWLGTPEGKRLADGELVQKVDDGVVESRLSFHFQDGSLYDEVVHFSQDGVFLLLAYALEEKGPSFAEDRRISFDRRSSRYRVVAKPREESDEKSHEGEVEIPEDVYNGMSGLLIRNAGEDMQAHLLAFTPEPRLLESSVVLEGVDNFAVGEQRRRARRYLLDLELKGFTGVLAKAVGKAPPDVRYWIADPVPAFLEFEGAMYLNGPTWRVEPTRARWRKKEAEIGSR